MSFSDGQLRRVVPEKDGIHAGAGRPNPLYRSVAFIGGVVLSVRNLTGVDPILEGLGKGISP